MVGSRRGVRGDTEAPESVSEYQDISRRRIRSSEYQIQRKTQDPGTEKLLYSTGNSCRQAGTRTQRENDLKSLIQSHYSTILTS
jgi:hypothetical protein